MPHLVATVGAQTNVARRKDLVAAKINVGDVRDRRVAVAFALVQHVFERPEACAECNLRFIVEALVAKDQNGVIVKCATQLRNGRIIEWYGQVDTVDLRSQIVR